MSDRRTFSQAPGVGAHPRFLTMVHSDPQGMIGLVLQCVDRLHVYSSAAHFADVAGRDAGASWKSILNSLYELLGKEGDGFLAQLLMSVSEAHRTLPAVLWLASCRGCQLVP